MNRDGSVRNLAQLERSGSTARVLNLNAIAKRTADDPEYQRRPLFHNDLLNRAIIIKHRLRRNEYELFDTYRLLATKVVLPISPDDLNVGAYSFFVGQRGYDEMLDHLMGHKVNQHDRRVLRILNETPTLDPFVLREQFKRNRLEPSPRYFNIGPADLERMIAFVAAEIEPLVNLTEGTGGKNSSTRLAQKLLSSTVDQETEPLRHTLKLDATDHREGVFCWKGFLYYKWCLHELQPHVDQVGWEVSRVKLQGLVRPDLAAKIELSRTRLRKSMAATCVSVSATIGIYDDAYDHLVERLDPAPFRQFLLSAPALFSRLGEGLGAIQHIVSYWRYRFPPGHLSPIDPVDLSEILDDFLHGLEAFEVNDGTVSHFERAMLA